MAERSLRYGLFIEDKTFGKGLSAGARKADRFGRDIGRSFDRAGRDSGQRFGLRLNKSLGGGMSASAGIVRKGAGLIGAGFAAAGIAGFARDAVNLAATFDKTMRQTAAVAKVPAKEIKELRDVALDMGAKTSFSAREAGNAMLALGKGGLTFAQMKAGALSATLTLAAAGGIELGESAGFVVQGLTTFGLKADKAADVAAALAGAANASTASVEDLGLALSQVGPGARNAGLSIQETAGVLAAFTNNGLKGSDAGTSLKTMLSRLVPTTNLAKDAMRDLNLKFTDSHGAMLPITEIAEKIRVKFKDLTDAERTKAMATIFGSDATRAATVLMNEGSRGLAKYIKATNDRAAAEKLAKTNTEGAAGAFERLSGAVETVKIRAGDTMLPMLADVATTIADRVIPAISKWVGQFRDDLLPHLGRMKDAWDANKGALATFATSLTSSQDELTSTGDKAETLADSVVALANAAGDASRFLSTLGGALNNVDQASDKTGSSIHENLVRPMGEFFARSALGQGTLRLYRVALRETKGDLADLGIHLGSAAGSTDRLKAAGDRHISTLRAEKDAVNALKDALRGEQASELDVRQAKLNVASTQQRLTELIKGGRRGSLEYRQAQIDLKRAQLDLKAKAEEYKTAQQRASAATGGAMRATQRAQGPYRKFGETAQTAGGRAYQMGKSARDGLNLIQSRRVTVMSSFGFKMPVGMSIHDIVGKIATGGYINDRGQVEVSRRYHRGGFLQGPGTETSDSIPARLSKGEYVVRAKAVRAVGRDTLDDINAQGFATGGPVLAATFPSGSVVARVARRYESVIDKVIQRMAGGWKKLSEEVFGGFGKPAILRFIRSTDPLPYRWGAAGPGAYDCSGLAGAVTAAHVGRPYGHGQRYFTTGSIRPGVLGLKSGLGGTLQIGVTAGSGHMAGRYGGLGFEAESTRTGIKIGSAASRPESFARRYHLAKGGLVEEQLLADLAAVGGLDIGGDRGRLRVNGQVFDRGGYLMPGTTVATNRTGKPERVVGPAETMTVNLATPTRRALARDIADALVAAGMRPVPLDSRRAEQVLAGAGLSNDRRR